MFVAESFVNRLNQTIEPGDRVLVVTVSTGTVGTYIGIYQGINKSKSEYGSDTYRIHYYPGERPVEDGLNHYEYMGKTYTYPNYKMVPDSEYFKTRLSRLGRIYKMG